MDGLQGTTEEPDLEILKVEWQEGMTLVRGGKQVGLKTERGGRCWGGGQGRGSGTAKVAKVLAALWFSDIFSLEVFF